MQTTGAHLGKGLSELFGLASPKILDRWWVRIPAQLRSYSAVFSTAWADGMYLTVWPRWAMLLSFFSLAFGFLEGASHWSFLTIDATRAASPPAIVFAQMLPLLVIAVVVGALSANAGTMLVLGYAIGDFVFAGPQLQLSGNAILPQFFYLRLPQLISYFFFFLLAAVPILLAKPLLSGLNRRIQGADTASVVVRTGAAATVQAALAYGWTLAAVMVIRISWAWAGQYPPLSEKYYLEATDPWLPVAAAAGVLMRGWLTHRAQSSKTLQARVRELLLALYAAEQRSSLSRRFPAWARIVLTALVMTLLTAGYINSLLLGAFVFVVYGSILVARTCFLPRLGIWTRWTGAVGKVPLIVRLALVMLAGYLITKSVLALPGQATQLNGVPGQFGPEIASALLALLLAGALLPQTSASTAQKSPIGKPHAAPKGTQLRNVGTQLMLLGSLVLLITSRAYADICLDPRCCFGADRFTLMAMAGLLLLLAILLLWPLLELLWPYVLMVLEPIIDLVTGVPRLIDEIMGTLLGDVLFPAPALRETPIEPLVAAGDVPEFRTAEEIVRDARLGVDPRTGQLREGEIAVAQRLEEQVGQLTREASGDYEWVDARGTTYDAVGPAPGEHFNAQQFNQAIAGHLNKQGLDRVVVDIANLSDEQQNAVIDFVNHLDRAQRARIILLE
jgi:hypothetical protein